ncbi:hypothetical protein ACX0G9_08530 [Flavitalea flava]
MLKTEMSSIIKKDLGVFLKNYGYKFNTKAAGFLRSFEGGFNQIGIAIFDYRPKFLVSPFFLIRIDKVEQIVQKHVLVMEKYKDITYTFNVGIEHFTGIKEYEIRTEEELHKLLRQIKEVYANEVDTFLRHYSEIGNLNKVLNEENRKINVINEPDNYIRSIIIARLNGNPNFSEVAEGYFNKYLKEYSLDIEDGPNRIRETINYLNSI